MNWGIETKSKQTSFVDFRHRQLFFQSCDKSIEPPKPLKHTFNNDINLKQVERKAFGVIKDPQIDRRLDLNAVSGRARKNFHHTHETQAKGILSYDSALEFRGEKVPAKVNEMPLQKYKKPQEFIARSITSQMNRDKMHGVNWVLGDDGTKENVHLSQSDFRTKSLKTKQMLFPQQSNLHTLTHEYSASTLTQKHVPNLFFKETAVTKKQRMKMMVEERRKQLLLNMNARVTTPSIQKVFAISDPQQQLQLSPYQPQINLESGIESNLAVERSRQMPDLKAQRDFLLYNQPNKLISYSKSQMHTVTSPPRTAMNTEFQFYQTDATDGHKHSQESRRQIKTAADFRQHPDDDESLRQALTHNTIKGKMSLQEMTEEQTSRVSHTNKIKLKNQKFIQKLSKASAKIFEQIQFNNVMLSLEQLSYEIETSKQSRSQRVNLISDFDNILKKFFKQLCIKIDDLVSSKVDLETQLIKERQTTEVLREQIKGFQTNDFTPGEKINLKVKIQKLKQQLQEKEQLLKSHIDLSSKQQILAQIKIEELTKELRRVTNMNQGDAEATLKFYEKTKAFNDVIMKLDSDIKAKDKLIVKLQWSKGEVKDVIFDKEKEIEKLQQVIKEWEVKNQALRDEIKEKESEIANRVQAYEAKKGELYKMQEEYKRKCETFDTLKAVAKEIQKKNEELEKEIWMGKGSSKDNDPLGNEVNLDQFLFGSQNPYALSNNTKLSVILRGKELRIGNSGLESALVKEADLKRIEVGDDGSIAQSQSSSGVPQVQQEGESQQIFNFRDFPLFSYFYGRPNFIQFIDHLIKDPNTLNPQNEQPKKFKFEPPFPQWLFATCRAILDSKYFEYVLYEDIGFANVTRLTDFCYSWLGQFKVDEQSRQVRKLDFEEREKADEIRLQFAIGLQSVKAQRVWEYQIFNDFLQEKYSHDELFFYLHCRQILYKGPQLQDTSSTHERIYNIDVKKLSSSIDIIFCKLPREERDQIYKKILEVSKDYQLILLQQQSKRDEKAKAALDKFIKQRQDLAKLQKQGKAIEAIDSQIILRIFLEYYVREKKVRAFILKRLFEEQPRLGTSAKAGLSFYYFRKVMEQFDPDMLEIDIATLYRDAWTAGVGVVNFDAFYLVANERPFFLKSIRCMALHTPPQMNAYDDIDIEGKYNQKLDYVYNLWKKEDGLFTQFKKRMEETGNELMLNKFVKLEELLRKKSQMDLSMYRGRDMIQVFRRLWQWMLFYRASYMEVYDQDDILGSFFSGIDSVKQEFETYQALGNRIFKEMALVRSEYLRKLSQVKKIQKIYRNKQNMEWEQLQKKLLS